MIPNVSYVDFLRALSLGGLIGAGIAGIVYLKFPYFQGVCNLSTFVFFGGLIGAGTQRGIQGILNYTLYPIGRFLSYYEKLVELDLLKRFGSITEEQHTLINAKLTEERFLGSSNRQLPP